MQSRKITIVSTKTQSKKVIMSSATTLAELKSDLRTNNIDYENMTFFEGTSKVELKNDDSVLPHDIPYKGTITNELVFMLTNTNKKIKSGAMSRMEAYNAIKSMSLQDACLKNFGKNFTMCKTADLIDLIERCKNNTPQTSTTPVHNNNKCVDIEARVAIIKLTELLEEGGYIEDYEKSEVLNTLNTCKGKDATSTTKIESSYSDEEIDSMFRNMDI